MPWISQREAYASPGRPGCAAQQAAQAPGQPHFKLARSGDAMRATGGDCYGASDVERPKGAERRRAELLSPEGVRMASPRRFQDLGGRPGDPARSFVSKPP